MPLHLIHLPLDIRIEIYSFASRCIWKLIFILGDLECMNYIWDLNIPIEDDLRPCELLSRYGNILSIKWFHEQDAQTKYPSLFFWDEWTSAEAARGGSVKVLLYLKENNCPMNELCYS
jgi:hypothetical protein